MNTKATSARRPLWWAVLIGGFVLLVASVGLALSAQGGPDFGESSLQTPEPVETAVAGPAPVPAENTAGPTTEPEPAPPEPTAAQRTVPLVPTEARRPAVASDTSDTAVPVALRIPSVDIVVDVVPVGVDQDGQMEIPDSGFDVGWYRYGAVPGQDEGSAVLASHVDTLAEGKGVLARLPDLRAGDVVSVTLDDGTVVDYEVTGRRTVPKAELDAQALFDRSGPARLQLVTCGGPWQPERSSYRDNVIVTAEPVSASS